MADGGPSEATGRTSSSGGPVRHRGDILPRRSGPSTPTLYTS